MFFTIKRYTGPDQAPFQPARWQYHGTTRVPHSGRRDRKGTLYRKMENGGGSVHSITCGLLCTDFPLGVLSQIITLSDLECDYINARACCSKLNKWVIPEMVGQCLSTMLMLVSMHWFTFFLNLPVAAWNIYRYVKVPLGNMGVFDPTEIHNRGQLKSHMKEAMIKLGYHLLCFFIYLYSMILALIND
uniref:Cornichon family member 4 n=2 Tax=Gasterosteus aculeatus aculeatus TaxID=481459 RepID=A0AAQ4S3X9_GASAC